MLRLPARSQARRPLRGLRRLLLRLPNELLEPLRLQVVYGCSLPEIADQLGISEEEATRRVRCARCLVYGVAVD